MNLLYISCDPGVPVLGHKGASVHVREMVAAFSALGADVTVASPRVEPEGDELVPRASLVRLDPVRADVHPTIWSLRQAMRAQARQVEEIAREHRVDAIYERLSLFAGAGVQTAKRLGLAHALEVNAPLREEAMRFRSLPHPGEAARILRRVYAETDHIFAVSEPLTAALAGEGVPRSKITVAPNGVDPQKFNRPGRRSSEAFAIGFVGSLKPWHGIGLLLEAFARAVALRPDLRLEIVGSGPERAAVDQAALPPERFTYHGALPHAGAIEVLTNWDVGIAPFLPLPDFYFSPLKVIEYMAAGVCPIASDLGQIRTLLGDGTRGVLVEPGNAAALADAIVRLAADRTRAAQLGRRARAFALASLTWRGNARQALRILEASSPTPAIRA